MTGHALRRTRYAEWLAAVGIRFGFAEEVPALATRTAKGLSNDTPPVELWHAIVPTLRVLERVREQFGATTVHSAYRALGYNLAVGGVGDSQHSQNTAVDFACATGTPADWAAFLRALRTDGVFTGGIGTYATKGFVHCDTRGTVADWVG